MRTRRGAIISGAAAAAAAGVIVAVIAVMSPAAPAAGPSAPEAPVPGASLPADYRDVLPSGAPSFTASFSGPQLDTSVWATCYPQTNPAAGCTNFGNAKEAEWFLPGQVQVAGGMLRLTASRQPTRGLDSVGSPKTYGCRSGMVTTYPGFNFKYGFLQVQARIPHAAGLWPALWLAATSLHWPPEMDMIESQGVDAASDAWFHPDPSSIPAVSGDVPVRLTSGWQTFSLYWTSSKMEYFVGTRKVLTITSHVPQQEMYFIADLAEYQPPAPGKCSGELDIRSLKYWKPA